MGRHYENIYSPKVITLIINGLLSDREKGLNQHSWVLSEGGQEVGAKLSQEWIWVCFCVWSILHVRSCELENLKQAGKTDEGQVSLCAKQLFFKKSGMSGR